MLWAPCEGAPTANMKKWLGLRLTVGVVVAALTAPWLAAIDPMVTDFASSLKPPGSPGHPLGTDQLGRDLLARVLYGARLALFIGACTVAVTAVVGGLLGLVSGFVEGWPATAIMRLADVQLSFPFILLALTINAIVRLRLRHIILSLSAAGWGGVSGGGAGADGARRDPARRLAARHARSEAAGLAAMLAERSLDLEVDRRADAFDLVQALPRLVPEHEERHDDDGNLAAHDPQHQLRKRGLAHLACDYRPAPDRGQRHDPDTA